MLIEEVRHRIIRALPDNFLEDDKNREALTVMGNALEKQIPKKPNLKVEIRRTYAACPNCNRILTFEDKTTANFYKFNYCFDCGQALDWRDEE